MNSTNRRQVGARGVPQPFNPQPGHARQVKPVVAKLKKVVSTHRVKTSIVPSAFHSLATPKAAQPKMANDRGKGTPPVAPPVYRPLQAPMVLQTKSTSPQSPQTGQAPRKSSAVPVSHTIQLKCPHGLENKKKCKACQQSLQDRNVNKFVSYQTPNKKTIEKDVKKVKELKTTLAHGSGNNQSNQSSKTKKILQDLKD
jgi:hypothetical protein